MPRTDRSLPARLLAIALWGSALFGLVVVVFGLCFVVDDASSHTDEFDGLGEFFGGVIAATGALWFAVHAALAGWLRRALRRGRRLTAVGSVSATTGAVLVAATPITLGFTADVAVIATMLGVCLLVVVSGVVAAVSGLRSRPSPDWPETFTGAGLGTGEA
jgi:hypothetical protein